VLWGDVDWAETGLAIWNVLYWVGIALAVLVGILVLICAIGILLPRYHQVRRRVEIKQTPETVWQTLTDFAAVPGWHAQILKVERMDDRDGHEVWRETLQGEYTMTMETTEATPPRRLVRHIADEKGPFAGRWEFDLTPTTDGCRVTITEFGDIANPFFRCMARLLMNPALYLEMYLAALAKKFGEEPAITEK
jgi:hypothetical protein